MMHCQVIKALPLQLTIFSKKVNTFIKLQGDIMNGKKMLVIFALCLSSFSVFADTTTTKKIVEKDNSALNRNNQVTAESQVHGSDADVEVTRQLRQKLVADDKLSMNAHNIKIVTIKDVITLEGPVASKAEKMKIESLARSLSANKKINNKLTY